MPPVHAAREARSSSGPRPSWPARHRSVVRALCVAVALIVRLHHAGFGLPALYHPDERARIASGIEAVAAELRPRLEQPAVVR